MEKYSTTEMAGNQKKIDPTTRKYEGGDKSKDEKGSEAFKFLK